MNLVTTKMIIELPNCAGHFKSKLFNGITKLGHFQKKFTKSIVVMIPKPEKDQTIPSSYRPISLLSCLSKLF